MHLIDDKKAKLPTIKAESYEDFIGKIDEFVEIKGKKEGPLNVSADLMKIFKRYPQRNEECFRIKYGNSW